MEKKWIRIFLFTVLTFGLTTAPAIFTKVLRPLVSSWHKIKIAVYLEDGLESQKLLKKLLIILKQLEIF